MIKTYITAEQANSVLPDRETIHTFYNSGFGLLGADWSKKDILDKLLKSEIIELTGPQARGMGHGICAYNKNTKWQSEILFIETDEEKLTEMEKMIEKKKVCDNCKFFLGCGDFDLCCSIQKRRLCYGADAACESFIEKKGNE